MDISTDPGIGYVFRVTIDGEQLGVFTKLDGLSAKYEVEKVQEGGENGYVHHLPGRVTYENVKLSRPVDGGSANLAVWFSRLQTNVPNKQQTARNTASITAYGPHGKPLMSWNLRDVFPVSYKGPSFEAGQSKVLIETIELAHNGFDPVSDGPGPSGRKPIAPGGAGAAVSQARAGANVAMGSSAGMQGRARAEVGGMY